MSMLLSFDCMLHTHDCCSSSSLVATSFALVYDDKSTSLSLRIPYFLISEATQRIATAPMMAVPSCPSMPPHVMPSCSKSQPPTKPPKSPNTRFMMNPKPPPFINLPAQKPARHPNTIEPISPIIFQYLVKLFFSAAKVRKIRLNENKNNIF